MADLHSGSSSKEMLTNVFSYERIIYLCSVQGKKA